MDCIKAKPTRQSHEGGVHTADQGNDDTVNVLSVDKWEILKDLTEAKEVFRVSNRDLTVLHALVSFIRPRQLTAGSSLVVFPSNRTLAARAHGMAESTLRRHLAALVKAGLIARRDSPNRKRYARRAMEGEVVHAYGLDLEPLLRRSFEIRTAAKNIAAERQDLENLRDHVLYLLSELRKTNVDEFNHHSVAARKCLRRKPNVTVLETLKDQLETSLNMHANSEVLSVNDVQNERHIQDQSYTNSVPLSSPSKSIPKLDDVLIRCPSLTDYGPIESWSCMIRQASILSGFMGITAETWQHAQRELGPIPASLAVAVIHEKFGEIQNPGGFLRKIAQTASGSFDVISKLMNSLSPTRRCIT